MPFFNNPSIPRHQHQHQRRRHHRLGHQRPISVSQYDLAGRLQVHTSFTTNSINGGVINTTYDYDSAGNVLAEASIDEQGTSTTHLLEYTWNAQDGYQEQSVAASLWNDGVQTGSTVNATAFNYDDNGNAVGTAEGSIAFGATAQVTDQSDLAPVFRIPLPASDPIRNAAVI